MTDRHTPGQMNGFNFKLARALGCHADEVLVSVVVATEHEVVGYASTPRGQKDFIYSRQSSSFSYLAGSA